MFKKFVQYFCFQNVNSGFVDGDMVVSYSEHRAKYVSKGKGNDFKLAVRQMDEYISDPNVWNFQFVSAHFFISFDFHFPEISRPCICEYWNVKTANQN